MPDLSTMVVFAGVALVLLLIPGPAVLYITTRSVTQGRAAGMASVLGIATGSLVHVAAATVGLSALLVGSAVAFHTVRSIGAAYLVYLGIQRLRRRPAGEDPNVRQRRQPLKAVYAQGVVINVLNPKTALFLFAFLPQFIEPERGLVAVQTLILGCLFVALGILSDGAYALISAALGDRLRDKAGSRRAGVVSGLVYVGLGVATAADGRRA